MSDWATVWMRAGPKVMSDTILERGYVTKSGVKYWIRARRRGVSGDLRLGDYSALYIEVTVRKGEATWEYTIAIYEPEEGSREAEAKAEFCPYEEGLACFSSKAYPHAGAALAFARATVARIERTRDGSRAVAAVARRVIRKVEEWIRRERQL